MELWKGQPAGRYSLFLYQNNEVIKMGCAGLAWLLTTDDDEYLFSFVAYKWAVSIYGAYMRVRGSLRLWVYWWLSG